MVDEAKNNDKGVSETDDVKMKKTISMHEDVPVWYDCCSCEAEPYWVEAMAAVLPDKKDA